MLTMSAHVPHMQLFREVLEPPSKHKGRAVPRRAERPEAEGPKRRQYHLLNMSRIGGDLGTRIFRTRTKSRKDELINDFVFVGFLVGNDFLPRIPAFRGLTVGLETSVAVLESAMGRGLLTYWDEAQKRYIRRLHPGRILCSLTWPTASPRTSSGGSRTRRPTRSISRRRRGPRTDPRGGGRPGPGRL